MTPTDYRDAPNAAWAWMYWRPASKHAAMTAKRYLARAPVGASGSGMQRFAIFKSASENWKTNHDDRPVKTAAAWLALLAFLSLFVWQPWEPKWTALPTVPDFYLGTWKNVTHAGAPDAYLVIQKEDLIRSAASEESIKSVRMLPGGKFLKLVTAGGDGSQSQYDIATKGDDLISIGRWIPTGFNDDMGFVEMGQFVRIDALKH